MKTKLDEINSITLKNAINNTANNRNSRKAIEDSLNIIKLIETNDHIKKLWIQYQEKFEYAKEISFSEVIEAIKTINNILNADETIK